jgi:hypothetical protein
LIDGLKWSGREDRRPLASVYFQKEPEERRNRGLLNGGEKRTPSLLTLAPTNVQPRVALPVAHYG